MKFKRNVFCPVISSAVEKFKMKMLNQIDLKSIGCEYFSILNMFFINLNVENEVCRGLK